MWRWVLSAALVGILPGAATADVYSYQQDNGTFAFTDDPEQVPERYRADVQQAPDQPLTDYPRLTVRATPALAPKEQTEASGPPAWVTDASDRSVPRLPQPTAPEAYIKVGPGLSIPVQGGPEAEPIRVEHAYRWIDGRYSRVVIVRRGDQILVEAEELGPGY